MNGRLWFVGGLACFVVTSHAAAPSGLGFRETTTALTGVSAITDIEWAPDASQRLFIAEQRGVVRIYQNGSLLPTPFVTETPVHTISECGLIGMCFDPNFVQNGYVYFFVTSTGSEQKIVRYTDAGGVGINRFEVVTNLPTLGGIHVGGALAVGPDGRLYWAIGELGNGTGVDANLTSLAAKVGRANLDGTVPALNPFVDGVGPNHELIWARGFRNPFKIAFQPATGLLWVNVAGTSYEQIFLVNRGDHAGFNDYENNQPAGYITPKIKYRTNGTDTRSLAANGASRQNDIATFTTTTTHGFRKGEKITISGVADASFNGSFYVESVQSATIFTLRQPGPNATSSGGTAVTLDMGGAATGGAFYNATAFPPEYHGNYFFCDYNSGRISRAVLDAANEVFSVDYFISSVSGAVDVNTGPDGNLYYAGVNVSTLYQLTYTNGPQTLVVSPSFLNMAEGGVAVFNVRLATAPAANVSVTIAHAAGDSTISSTNASLTFTPVNYSVPQPVYVRAAADGNPRSSQTTFSVAAAGITAQEVTVRAYDSDATGPYFSSIAVSNNAAHLQIAAEPRVRLVLESAPDLQTWTPVATNVLQTNSTTIIDPIGAASNRFYRALATP